MRKHRTTVFPEKLMNIPLTKRGKIKMWLLLIFIFSVEWIAEYYLMAWSQDDIFWHLVLGSVLYLASTVAWAFLLKLGEMSIVSIIYSAFGLISVFIISISVFKEAITWKNLIGVTLTIIAIILVTV